MSTLAASQPFTAPKWKRRTLHSPVRMRCTAALGLYLFTVAGLAIAAPATLRFAYPAMSFLLAIFLFIQSRTTYVGFVSSLWYLSPVLRRWVDYKAGFVLTNPLLLASFLATLVSGYVLLTNLRLLSRSVTLPFSCALAGIFFGTVVGLTRYPAQAVFQADLNWLAPVCFAFFLYAERHRYRDFQTTIQNSILYGTLIAGAYGVYQFFFLPVWDRLWMVDLGAEPFGVPEPLQLRVFSTLNAPATCAAYMMAGLLMLFALKGRLRILAAPLAFLALIFTSSRSSWIGLIFGVGYLALALPGKARLRIAWAALACVVMLAAAATYIPVVNHMATDRFKSMSDPKQDVSYNARLIGHADAFTRLLDEPLGEGMGSLDIDHQTGGSDAGIGPHDSSILEALYALGFPGTLLYGAAILFAASRIFAAARRHIRDPFGIAMRAILVAFFVQIALNSIFVGVFGFLTWTLIGMTLASGDLHQPVPESR